MNAHWFKSFVRPARARPRSRAGLASAAIVVASLGANAQSGPIVAWGDILFSGDPLPTGLFSRVVAGNGHSLAMRPDGSIVTWGYGAPLGVPPPDQYLGLAAGFGHNCVIRSDGTLLCWGLNDSGQCNAPSGSFTRVAAGYRASAAIRSDGTIATWGFNSEIPPPSGAFKDIWVGKWWYLAQRTDDSLVAWGTDQFGVVSTVPTGPFLTATASGSWFAYALRYDGTIVHWGYNGDGVANVPAGAFVAVSGGEYGSLAVRPNGTVVCWGYGWFNENTPPGARVMSASAGSLFGIGIAACYANCDGSTADPFLNINDFVCYLNYFAAGEQYANCDASTTP
ncbi:MAG: RCC1 domain-containing protein, partial [Phycisphaerales bacterium]